MHPVADAENGALAIEDMSNQRLDDSLRAATLPPSYNLSTRLEPGPVCAASSLARSAADTACASANTEVTEESLDTGNRNTTDSSAQASQKTAH